MKNKKNDILVLREQLQQEQERTKRALADYENLNRRVREDKMNWMALATQELMLDLIEPLDHLYLAAEKINNQGLNLVVSALWQKLKDHGLEIIEPQGQKFDVNTMEAVEVQTKNLDTAVVIKVISRGYKLNQKVIKHAKVILGDK